MSLFAKISFIFTRSQKIKIFILFGLSFIGAILETLGVTMIMPFISVVMNPGYIFEQPILEYAYNIFGLKNTNSFLILTALILMLIYFLKAVYLFTMYRLQYRFIYNNQIRLSSMLMRSYLNKTYEYLSDKNSSEVIRAVTQDVAQMFALVLNIILLATELMVVACIVALLVIVDPLMILLLMAAFGILAFALMSTYRRTLKGAAVNNQKSHKEMIKWISQGIGGIKEIKVLVKEQHFIKEYSEAASIYAKAQQNYTFLSQAPRLTIEAIGVIIILAIISVMLYTGRNLSGMLPQLSALALAAFRIMPSFNRIVNNYNSIVFFRPSVDLVYNELQDINTDINKTDSSGEELSLQLGDIIKVNGLSYKYPNTENNVLDKVDFEIPLKKSIAIIGSSGAGKTTFADIFLGLLRPVEGCISVNGINIHENKKEWAKKLGYIPQSIYLCDDSIRNNVAFGIGSAEVDEQKVIEALKKAQLYEFIKTLPKGIHTEIGERGIKLSGGQRQRIGIARAFYNDPEIFVLDEATSALDNETEEAVMDAINTIRHEKTLIIIAHRLSTIQGCDIVYKIENGKVLREE